jgi:acyl carrier protein
VAEPDERNVVAPEGEVETFIAEIWADVLGTATIGAEDNFFADLNGHSLLATRVISRLQAALDLDIPLRTLFEHATLRTFAFAVEELLLEGEASPAAS